jgi:hypothetical protein
VFPAHGSVVTETGVAILENKTFDAPTIYNINSASPHDHFNEANGGVITDTASASYITMYRVGQVEPTDPMLLLPWTSVWFDGDKMAGREVYLHATYEHVTAGEIQVKLYSYTDFDNPGPAIASCQPEMNRLERGLNQ